LAITFISLGSLLAGAMYGRIYIKMKSKALILFYLVCAAGFFVGTMIPHIIGVYVGAFLLGWGYIAFVPYLQEMAARTFPHLGGKATSTILIFQSIGAFAAPYLGTVFSLITQQLSTQFLFVGIGYLILSLIAFFMMKSEEK
jgi:MFS family permease